VVNHDITTLLASTDLATVVLDSELRIQRSTAAASRVFNLHASGTGRPLSGLAPALVDIDLPATARTVASTLTPIEREVSSRDGHHYLLSASPLVTSHGVGVVLTLVDVTDLRRREQALQASRDELSVELRHMTRLQVASTRLGGPGDLREALDEILHAALEITGADMGCIQQCDDAGLLRISGQVGLPKSFLDFCGRQVTDVEPVSRAAMTTCRRIALDDLADSTMLDGTASRDAFVNAGVRAMQSTPLFDRAGGFLGILSTHYRSPHRFDEAERRWLDLLARPAGDAIHRRQTETLTGLATGILEQRDEIFDARFVCQFVVGNLGNVHGPGISTVRIALIFFVVPADAGRRGVLAVCPQRALRGWALRGAASPAAPACVPRTLAAPACPVMRSQQIGAMRLHVAAHARCSWCLVTTRRGRRQPRAPRRLNPE